MFRKVACVGAGLIGRGWAITFSTKGLRVSLYDADSRRLADSMSQIETRLRFLSKHGWIPARRVREALKNIGVEESLGEAVQNVDYVQESVFENLELKRKVFREIERHVPENTVMASSSSSLTATSIQKGMAHPERCLVVHPWNPPYLIPLVEIVPGGETSRETVEETFRFMRSLDKEPIILRKEAPGHVANRLQAALLREALNIVDKGVASVLDVDRAVTHGPGLRWAVAGPFLTLHLAGGEGGLRGAMKHLGPSYERRWRTLAHWTHVPEKAVEEAASSIEKHVKSTSMKEAEEKRDQRLLKLLKVLKYSQSRYVKNHPQEV
ncbi:MAG: 3-hydroxyacyl-CoA dehydrogenase NAD-binding domain-containing protein [Candidatus Bathyarchaeia archaeon]